MLAALFVTFVLASLGMVAVAKITQLALRKLQLDPYEVAEWLGLADAAVDEFTARRTGRSRDRARRLRLHQEQAGTGA